MSNIENFKIGKEKLEEYFEFLDNLRESGATNMWGAGQYLTSAFHMKGDKAAAVLAEWMRTFSVRHPKVAQ